MKQKNKTRKGQRSKRNFFWRVMDVRLRKWYISEEGEEMIQQTQEQAEGGVKN